VKPLDRQHPTDERLVALYFDDGVAPADEEDRAVRQHLHGCEACTWRYTALTAPLQQLRHDAASEADEAFTPGRLAAQRSAIRHRLESGAGTPRVVAFPGAQPARPRLAHRPAGRWMAAAAAAGLLVGVTAGRLVLHPETSAPTQAVRTVETPRLVADDGIRPVAGAQSENAPDMTFLYAVDSAVYTPRVECLQSLDSLTPHPSENLVAMMR
jgi:anti-sigma factor RsiW